eukprot:GFUD01003019.1.p1 GENE.GFUD01003019.1~~GFUD01003019.1.p1  ORF type:complete len:392 (-),score=91.25 GFUD01003019.1:223-1398(-)
MDQIQLLDLPSEVVLNIISFLKSKELCSVRSVSFFLKELCDKESVWISRAQSDYKVKFKVEENFSPRIFYQNVLHKFGKMLGLWQRQNLKFYSGILSVSYKDKSILFENLVPTSDIFCDLQRLKFLTVTMMTDNQKPVVTSHDKVSSTQNVEIKFAPGSKLDIVNSNMMDYITSPAEWRELLEEFRSWDTSQDTELALMKFVSLYHSRSIFSYLPLFSLDWSDRHSSPLGSCPIRPGLFKGSYGGHGVELVHLQVFWHTMQGATGVKVTGDPNVPFNEVTFNVLAGDCLDIPMDLQGTVRGVRTAMLDQETVPFQEDLLLGFRVPLDMMERVPVKWTQCRGRWAAEAQIASQMFQDPQFIQANFVLFSEDEFAVMFLDLNSISTFHRVKTL